MTTEELNALIAKAEAGDVAAMNQLGHIYGGNEFPDSNKAFYWYKKSAELGNFNSMANLGSWCYAYGNGVQIDLEKALYWLTRVAKECGDAWSAEKLNSIGVELQYGNYGRTIDLPLAFKFYESAAECGNSAGMCNEAYCLAHGIGTEIDYSKTFELYSKAVELGNQYGYSNLAWCYLNGNGVEKNISEAIKWFTDAAEKFGNIYSMKELTNIYGTLDGYINQELAVKWFLELIKRDCDPNSGVYEKTGYNKELYAKIKSIILNSTTEEEMMSAMSYGNGGSLLGGAMSFTTSNAKSYINQAEAAVQRNIEYKEELRRKAEEEAARKRAEEERARKEAEERARLERERQELQVRIEREERERRERQEREEKERLEREKRANAFSIKVQKDYPDGKDIEIPCQWQKEEMEVVKDYKKMVSYGSYAKLPDRFQESLIIPEGITHIGNSAFAYCEHFNSVVIPSSVTSIGRYAFSASGLAGELIIPEGVKSIGACAFSETRIKRVVFPNSLISLGENVFEGTYIERITVPKGTYKRFEKLLDGQRCWMDNRRVPLCIMIHRS